MSIAAELLDNYVTRIAAVTPSDDATERPFKHYDEDLFENMPDVPQSHRKFTVQFNEDYELYKQDGVGANFVMEVTRGVSVEIKYRVDGRQPLNAAKTIGDDVDLIVRALMEPIEYVGKPNGPTSTTGEEARTDQVGGIFLDWSDASPPEYVDVLITFSTIYRRE